MTVEECDHLEFTKPVPDGPGWVAVTCVACGRRVRARTFGELYADLAFGQETVEP